MANTIELEIYADEVMNKKFLGFGCLFVPINRKEELIKSLIKRRCQGKKEYFYWNFEDCPYNQNCKKEWHNLNNSEVHYTKIESTKSNALKNIALSWMDLISKNCQNNKDMSYFKAVYLDLEKLDMEKFGKKEIENAYNRFFRSTILGGAKYFFNKHHNKIIINKIYHVNSHGKETHDFFPLHVGYKINLSGNSKLIVKNEDIIFVDSDHKVYLDNKEDLINESQLIQFVDLFIGGSTQNIYNLSNDSFKKELAMKIRPIIKGLLEGNYSECMRYSDYVTISFFPKSSEMGLLQQLGKESLVFTAGKFYNKRKLEMLDYNPNQMDLDSWFKKE